MYRETLTITRPDTSAEFRPLIDTSISLPIFAGPYHQTGQFIDSSQSTTPNGLVFTRITDFLDQASYTTIQTAQETQYPTLITDCQAYETLHSHTRTVVFSTI